jgi:WD40 repeat protein
MSQGGANAADFAALVEHYLRGRIEGLPPDASGFESRHPEFGEPLRRVLESVERLLAGREPQGAVATATTPAPAGESRLGDFRIVREIGRGGMGVVYEAFQESLGRRVALKVLSPHLTSQPAHVRRFEREARASARLHHTNIVPVFGVGEEHGRHYFVMQCIDGPPLSEIIVALRRLAAGKSRSRPVAPPGPAVPPCETTLTADALAHTLWGGNGEASGKPASLPETVAWSEPEEAGTRIAAVPKAPRSLPVDFPSPNAWRRYVETVARIGAQAAEALEYAHQHGVLHRDIKPGNLLLDEKGTVWVTDFGLAKAAEAEDLTRSGEIIGTLRYMAPERFQGRCDARSDLYAVGLTLYELLALRPAFEDSDPNSLIRRIGRDDQHRVAPLPSAVPRDLATIVYKAIDPEPPRRYATAGALAEDLRRFLEHRPILARRQSPAERVRRWARRNPALAALSLLVAVLLVAGATTATVAAARFRGLAARERASRLREAEARRVVESTLADTYTTSGIDVGVEGDPARAALWFASAATLAPSDLARTETNLVRSRAWGRGLPQPVQAFTDPGPPIRTLAFAPDGRHLLVLDKGGACHVRDLSDGSSVPLPGAAGVAAWSPDGTRVAVGRDGAIDLYDFPALAHAGRLEVPGVVGALQFSDDGARLAAAVGGRVWVWTGSRGAPIELPEQPAAVVALVFGRRGQHLAVVTQPGQASVFALPIGPEPGAARLVLGPVASFGRAGPAAGHVPPVFVDEDRAVLTVTRPRRVTWWDLAGRTAPRELAVDGYVQRLVVSPDGRLVAVCAHAQATLWDTATGAQVASPVRHGNYVYDVAFGPNGAILSVGADRVARLWSLVTGRPLSPPILHQGEVERAAVAADGRRFATAQADGLIRVWTWQRDDPALRRVKLEAPHSFVRLSADGRFLLPEGWDSARGLRAARVYHTDSVEPAGPRLDVGGWLDAAAFAPDGRHVLTAAVRTGGIDPDAIDATRTPGHVQLWDWRSGRAAGPEIATPSEPIGVDFRPDGAQAAVVCAGGQVLLIEPAAGRVVRQMDHGATATFRLLTRRRVRYSPDGTSLATWGLGDHACVWDSATGALRFRADLGSLGRDLIFSRDGRVVFVGSSDRASAWRVADGRPAAAPLMHPDWVFALALSPDGDALLTACRDRMARLWDWRAGRLRCPPFEHHEEVLGVAFAPDGSWLLTAARDGGVLSWDARTGRVLGPPLSLPAQVNQVEIAPDGREAVAVGTFGGVLRIRLDEYLGAREPARGVSAQRTWAELLAGQAVHAGGGVVNLTSREWLERWDEQRRAER